MRINIKIILVTFIIGILLSIYYYPKLSNKQVIEFETSSPNDPCKTWSCYKITTKKGIDIITYEVGDDERCDKIMYYPTFHSEIATKVIGLDSIGPELERLYIKKEEGRCR